MMGSLLSSMSPGLAGCILLGHTLICKMLQTFVWRGPGSKAASLGADNWVKVKSQLEEIPMYRIMSAAQLNEAEYAGPLIAALFFCSAKNVDVGGAAFLAVFGQVGYYAPRVLFATESNCWNGYPFYVPSAVSRYIAMGMLTFAIFKNVA